MSQVVHWLLCGSLTTQFKPTKPQKKHEKTAPGRCSWTCAGPYVPQTLRTQVLKKMTSQPTFFCCTYFPKSVIKLHRLFNTSNINTFWHVFEKLRHVCVINFLVCVRKHKSNLPTNIRTTVGKKTQWCVSVEKCTFWVKPHSCLILWQHGVFYFTKVCIFL